MAMRAEGTGILVVRKDRLDTLTPQYVGGGSLDEGFPWAEIDRPETIRVKWHPSAARFEYGMRNPAVYAGLSLAIEHLNAIGWSAIRAHQRRQTQRLKERLPSCRGSAYRPRWRSDVRRRS